MYRCVFCVYYICIYANICVKKWSSYCSSVRICCAVFSSGNNGIIMCIYLKGREEKKIVANFIEYGTGKERYRKWVGRIP